EGGFGDQHVRTLPDQLRREGQRQVFRQLQVRERQRGLAPARGCRPRQRREEVGGLIDLRFEGRQRRLGACHLALQAEDVGVGDGPPRRLGVRDANLFTKERQGRL